MNSYLSQAGYILDAKTNVWSRPEFNGIAYSDGAEVEQRIYEAICSAHELNSVSAELAKNIIDWPSKYHLSSLRGNLLRPFSEQLIGKVLEVGAGCGAITRLLGEYGAEVVAVEGSHARAITAAARCRDLNNVNVIVETFHQLKENPIYDVVTLVGVLEYARKYFPVKNGDPIDALIRHAKAFLKPDGVLIVAIENQLGLKYFAGCSEDHVGQPMFGIEGRYHADGVVTFGRRELQERLADAGLAAQRWWYPFPDYKLPTVVVSEELLSNPSFEKMSAVVDPTFESDPQLPHSPLFQLDRAWKTITRNGLGPELANSFLVFAGKHETCFLNQPSGVAYHFSADRKSQYAKAVIFKLDQGGAINVQQEALYPTQCHHKSDPIGMTIESEVAFIEGCLWSRKLKDILTNEGWNVDDLIGWAVRWYGELLKIANLEGDLTSLSIRTAVPGNLIDAIPKNLIVRSDNETYFIDREWKLDFSIELGYLAFRAIFLSLVSVGRVNLPEPGTSLKRGELFRKVMQSLGLWITEVDMLRYVEMENDFLDWAIGRKGDGAQEILKSELHTVLPGRLLTDLVSHSTAMNHGIALRDEQIVNLNRSVSEYEVQISRLNQILSEQEIKISNLGSDVSERDAKLIGLKQTIERLDGQIVILNNIVNERDTRIVNLSNIVSKQDAQIVNLVDVVRERDTRFCKLIDSRSWRMTKPFRFIGRLVRGEVKTAMAAFPSLSVNRQTVFIRRARNAMRYVLRGDFQALYARILARRRDAAIIAVEATAAKGSSKTCWAIMTTRHTRYIAHLIAEKLKSHGWNVDIFVDQGPAFFSHDWYIVLCPQMFDKLPPGEKRIVYQLEQSASSRWFTEGYFKILEDSLAVLEYALENIDFMQIKKIGYPHVHYLPIGASESYGEISPNQEKTCDVLFYGDSHSSMRRQKMLTALRENFNVRVVNEVFGTEVQEAIKQARVVINIHYYENAQLEMPRIQECLSLGVPVVSESTKDQGDYPEILDAVSFFDEGSIPEMILAVRLILDNPPSMVTLRRAVNYGAERFDFMFDRFLVAVGFLPATHVRAMRVSIPKNTDLVALSLPETIVRRKIFELERPRNCFVFDGIRRRPGWVGCGLSYFSLAQCALRQGLSSLTIMEDDVILPPDFEEKMKIIREYMNAGSKQRDLFSGVIAALHPECVVKSVETYKNMTFVTINKMTSMVFNIYSDRFLRLLLSWNPDNLDATSNTIDRFIESRSDLNIVVTLPFFVGHREEVHSTLWGFQNTQYVDMITSSEAILHEKVIAFQKKSNVEQAEVVH